MVRSSRLLQHSGTKSFRLMILVRSPVACITKRPFRPASAEVPASAVWKATGWGETFLFEVAVMHI
ncbi:MAG: hypothetical protein WC406_09550 [Methanoregula sp.]